MTSHGLPPNPPVAFLDPPGHRPCAANDVHQTARNRTQPLLISPVPPLSATTERYSGESILSSPSEGDDEHARHQDLDDIDQDDSDAEEIDPPRRPNYWPHPSPTTLINSAFELLLRPPDLIYSIQASSPFSIGPSSAGLRTSIHTPSTERSSSMSTPTGSGAQDGGRMTDHLVKEEEDTDQLDYDADAKDSPATIPESIEASGPVNPKRPRGRPRKHPLPSPDAQSKITKGRSKTGCITCRRRKKKCDETKPECLNCQKNAVSCEGYPERRVWKSGREKAEEARVARQSTQPRELSVLYDGVETDLDRQLLNHFIEHVSKVMSVSYGDSNPFKNLLLPMATRHTGLMHSILCLSSAHLAENGGHIEERRLFHLNRAIKLLKDDASLARHRNGASDEPIEDPIVATTIVLVLQSICNGEKEGEYRPHLDACKAMIDSKSEVGNAEFASFIYEFFAFHWMLSAITSLNRKDLDMTSDFALPAFIVQPGAGALLGVFDGLFSYISKITRLRDKIRYRHQNNIQPVVDEQTTSDAMVIDAYIRAWQPVQQPGTEGYIAAQLYRQCTWIYLYRTVHKSIPTKKIIDAVDEGLEYLRQLSPDASTQSILLMPLFLLGCSAFKEEQRPEIKKYLGTLKRYSNFRNIEPARKVVEAVWDLMNKGDESSWDWETVIQRFGWDFLAT